MKSTALPLILGLTFISCGEEDSVQQETCESTDLTNQVSFSDLSASVPDVVLDQFIDYPDDVGALGPNKDGYIHARHQVAMTYLVEHAIRHEDETVLDAFTRSLDYAFDHQTETGDFEFVVPPNAPNDQPPPADKLAHENAIFAYGLGMSLLLLEESEWYQQLPADHSSKLSIAVRREDIGGLLSYLKANIELLKQGDGMSPSRLLYDVVSIHSLSGYMEDEEGGKLVLPMLEQVFQARNLEEGYFVEARGWDSSYNGESIKLGFELYTMLAGSDHAEVRARLEEAITCAIHWQVTRILETGEISTEGNSLIYPGGETIGGREKRVDVEKTIRAFTYMSLLSEDPSFDELMNKVLDFYQ